MTAIDKLPAQPKSYPSGWPSDKRSRVYHVDGVYYIQHPERKKQRYFPDEKKWSEEP